MFIADKTEKKCFIACDEQTKKDGRCTCLSKIKKIQQLPQPEVSKCVYCDNKPYKKGASYCEEHMAGDDYS